MEIKRLVLGPLNTNTYLLKEDDKVLVIDPASKARRLIEEIGEDKLIGILLTHGHFDHTKAVDGLCEYFHCPVFLHHDDVVLARDKQSGKDFNIFTYIKSDINELPEGEMNIGPFKFETIYTPGHTKGSVVYVFLDDIFTGDTLFKLSVGRTDLASGNANELRESLKVFYHFKKNYHIWPGHDEDSDLYFELQNNPYL